MKTHALDLRDRRKSFGRLEEQVFDVLVIGAGITGCGIARDAAMRGLSVALVDRADIGAGTSSRSSKLIHGGLRYLAQGDLFVVKEAAVERRAVRAIAPHLAQTMPMIIPLRGKTDQAKMVAAMVAYEKLGGVAPEEAHEVWDQAELHAREPRVRSGKLIGAVVYPEYVTDDFRLTLANARSAASHGACVDTYARVETLLLEGGKAAGAIVQAALPGEDDAARVRARVVVNAAGPWVDAIRRLEDAAAKKKLQLTKGIHLVVRRERLPLDNTVIMATPDRRSIFAVPRDCFVYIGTTDTFYPQAEYWPGITSEDFDYLLLPASAMFDIEPLTGNDVVSAWAGLRPLLGAEGKSPSEISRRHETMEGPGGVLSVAGGKLTSYRSMAERVVNLCEKRLQRKSNPPPTAEEPLPGGDFAGGPEKLRSQLESLGLNPADSERAARLYGAEALEISSKDAGPAGEVRHAVECEGALTLEDYWFRRSARARFDVGPPSALIRAAEHMSALMGWSEDEQMRQIERCRNLHAEELKARAETGNQ
ncbi:MAG: glycerol-3-phosphate dehydrogenase/oxidase [Candidatus Abyssobacteria bacterium SURF_5]|uniref:Glycerol-3-phosphate dehydrogenase/oxidase n=1 Tax=Abyssobacteria bacterium (strain SURF_5) TaxID=2093360 RepID=A0A3A4NJF2_ABYX5|nr:MAG: glycerol-3-phosphate dehydrogenase/oxidase [Candidatus Abyssubacteria bacterium SURF_5]